MSGYGTRPFPEAAISSSKPPDDGKNPSAMMTALRQQRRVRKRRGSLRKTALLGGRDQGERRNGLRNKEMAMDAGDTNGEIRSDEMKTAEVAFEWKPVPTRQRLPQSHGTGVVTNGLSEEDEDTEISSKRERKVSSSQHSPAQSSFTDTITTPVPAVPASAPPDWTQASESLMGTSDSPRDDTDGPTDDEDLLNFRLSPNDPWRARDKNSASHISSLAGFATDIREPKNDQHTALSSQSYPFILTPSSSESLSHLSSKQSQARIKHSPSLPGTMQSRIRSPLSKQVVDKKDAAATTSIDDSSVPSLKARQHQPSFSQIPSPTVSPENAAASTSAATPPTIVVAGPTSPVWDYSETERWGWFILFVTWIVFVVGIGSCLGVWSWAWDVGETPYAPPELEDDPTLPIVGYYPALIILTAVMAWVWVVVAWVGMKYFRHANIVGDDI